MKIDFTSPIAKAITEIRIDDKSPAAVAIRLLIKLYCGYQLQTNDVLLFEVERVMETRIDYIGKRLVAA